MIKPPSAGNDKTGPAYLWNPNFNTRPAGWTFAASGSYSSVNTPNFRSMTTYQRKYELPWHPFSYVRKTRTYKFGVLGCRVQLFGGYNVYHEGYCHNNLPSFGTNSAYLDPANSTINLFDLGAEQKSLSRLQGQVASMSVNLAQAYGERKQTANLIAKRLQQIIVVAHAVKKGDFDSAIRELRRYGKPKGNPSRWKSTASNLSNYWLELQYGWKPLLQDIYGSAEAVANAAASSKPCKFTASASEEDVVYDVPLRQVTPPSGSNTYVELATVKRKDRCRFVLEVVEDQGMLASLASTGITNPALLAWELLPYSFVVDWFIPVGNYLKQQEYARGLTFLRGSKTISRSSTGATRFLWMPSNGQTTELQSNMQTTFESYSKTRTLLGGFPYQEFPSFRPQLGASRITSGIALLTQLFTKSKPVIR